MNPDFDVEVVWDGRIDGPNRGLLNVQPDVPAATEEAPPVDTVALENRRRLTAYHERILRSTVSEDRQQRSARALERLRRNA